MTYHSTPVAIGSKQEKTPDGFLICRDVPVARVGQQFYMPGELRRHDGTTVDAGPDGIIRVERPEEEVFAPTAIASANGKPVTMDHPAEFVNPRNASRYQVGTMMNPRRGEGEHAGFMVADLMITHDSAIRQIESGKRGVSLGYDAKYQNVGSGLERQHSILINHMALVLTGKPRCGPMCSIGDSTMSGKGFGAHLKGLLGAKLSPEELVEAEAAATRDAASLTSDAKLDTLGSKLDAMPALIATAVASEIAKAMKPATTARTADAATADATAAGTAFQDTLSKAYIVAPTYKHAALTADSMGDPAAIRTADCECKRGALKAAMALDATKAIVTTIGGAAVNVDTLDAVGVDTLFAGVAEAVRLRNNAVFAAAATAARPTEDAQPRTDYARAETLQANIEAARAKGAWGATH